MFSFRSGSQRVIIRLPTRGTDAGSWIVVEICDQVGKAFRIAGCIGLYGRSTPAAFIFDKWASHAFHFSLLHPIHASTTARTITRAKR